MSARDLRAAIALAIAGAEQAGWNVVAGAFFNIELSDGNMIESGDQANIVLLIPGLFPEATVAVEQDGLIAWPFDGDGDYFCCPLGAVAVSAGLPGPVLSVIAKTLGVDLGWIKSFAAGFDAADHDGEPPEEIVGGDGLVLAVDDDAFALGEEFRAAVCP